MSLKEDIKEEAEMLLEKLHVHKPIPLGKVLLGIVGLIFVVWFLLWLTAPKECIPGPESCDGIDNDCDGVVDNGLTQECGAAVAGECTLGITTCQNGKWSPCSGAIGPTAEVCDGLDNDCDGILDNLAAVSCYYGPEGSLGIGMCTEGVIGCENGQITGCDGMIIPHFEDCDGRDNDCDGEVDEDVQRPCYSGAKETRNIGECKSGITLCANAIWTPCAGEVLPQTETCDSKDNDCDGEVDEDC